MVTGDLIWEFGGEAIVRGTIRGAIRNRSGRVHLLGAAGEVVDATGATTFVERDAVVRPAA